MTPEVITSPTALTVAPATTAVLAPTTTPLEPPGSLATPPFATVSPVLSASTITAATPEPVIESRYAAISIAVTAAIVVGLAVLASIATHQVSLNASSPWVIWLAVAVGGLGGLSHEFAQSGGKILFFQRKVDGFHLGSLAGMILGAVAGLLAVRGLVLTPNAVAPTGQTGPLAIIFEVFFAGLALKGVAEAAGGQAVPSVPTPSNASQSNSLAVLRGAVTGATSERFEVKRTASSNRRIGSGDPNGIVLRRYCQLTIISLIPPSQLG